MRPRPETEGGPRASGARGLGRALLALALPLALLACDDHSAPVTPTRPSTAAVLDEEARRAEEREELDDLAGDELDEPLPSSADVESMGRDELELACSRGSQAACDLLGH